MKIIETTQLRASNRIDDSIGKKFGKLTVVRFAGYSVTPKGRKIPAMECVCDCGERVNIMLQSLTRGNSKACDNKSNHPKYEDRAEPMLNNLYNYAYKDSAKKRGLEFSLTKEEFRTIVATPCFYCGAEPRKQTRKTGKAMVSSGLVNGVDRVDNSQGYHLFNVVACCTLCNHAKHTMSQIEFLKLANRIAHMHPVIDI